MPESESKKKIFVIIPAFNEERSVASVVKHVRKEVPEAKILVVNDGSTDGTLTEAERSGAEVASAPYNLGIGGAVQIGFKVAAMEGYEVAVQIDGDGQHDAAYIRAIVKPILSGELEMCVGSRFLTDSEFKSTPLRRAGINFFCFLLRLITGLKLTDATSGFRAFHRNLIEKFAESYPIDFPEPETIKLAQRFGARIGEVPVKMRKRLGGKSSIRYFAVLYYMIKVTLAILIDTLRKKK